MSTFSEACSIHFRLQFLITQPDLDEKWALNPGDGVYTSVPFDGKITVPHIDVQRVFLRGYLGYR